MDEALVQHAEDQIDDQHGDQQQDAEALQRGLEGLRGALQAGGQRYRDTDFLLQRLDAVDGIAQRDAGQQVEGDGHRRQLALVVDGQGLRLAGEAGYRIERDQLAATAHVDAGQGLRIGLEFRGDFEDNLVLRRRAIDGRYLAGAEGALQGVLDLAEGQAERGELVAVDIDADHRAEIAQVVGDIDEAGQLADLLGQRAGPFVQFVEVGILQRVLVLCGGDLAADADHRRVLHIDLDARQGSQLGAQTLDDLVRRRFPLVLRLEDHEHRAGVGGRPNAAGADGRHERRDVRFLGDDLRHRPLVGDHRGEGGILGALGEGDDLAGIAARDEVLGHLGEQIAGEQQRGDETGQDGARVGHRQLQRFLVAGKQGGEEAFEHLEDAAVRFGLGMADIAAAQHRRQG